MLATLYNNHYVNCVIRSVCMYICMLHVVISLLCLGAIDVIVGLGKG